MSTRIVVLLISFFIAHTPLTAKPIIQNTVQGVVFQNVRVSILISKSAELLSCIELSTGIDIAAQGHNKIATATKKGGGSVQATKVSLTGNLLNLYFGKDVVQCKVSSKEDYFTFEVIGGDLDPFESVVFLDLKTKHDFSEHNPFVITGVAMTLNTNHKYYPTGEAQEVVGKCYVQTGLIGAKLAVVACRKDELRSILKSVYSSIPAGSVPIAYASGGPFALDNETNKYDCVLLYSVNPSKIPDWISFYSQFGIKQFEFLLGPSTFIQGDFTFPQFESASDFKQKVTDPLYDAGIISTLHTYAYYIDYSADDILSDPKWQQQLEFRETFTLSESISPTSSVIGMLGDKSSLINDDKYRSVHSPFALIDNEIIKYTVSPDGIVSCQRGQCGTIAKSHLKGTKVRIIGGYYSQIAPQIGSELFYEIARRTAVAYNEGGFRGFYFDALSGLSVHLKHAKLDGFVWYYGAAFINEVLKYCERDPLVLDISDMYASLWPSRGRGITLDNPLRGYKDFIDDHTAINRDFGERQYVTTLGWFNLFPTKEEFPFNFSTKYVFFDDVDYAGVKSIAYNQTMTYNPLRRADVEGKPALKRNLDNFTRYSKLRQEGYFSESVLSVLKEGLFEYKLEYNNGVWGFREAVYCRNKLRDISKDLLYGDNPFKKQKPFIRLENGYTSSAISSITLLKSGELNKWSKNVIQKQFREPLNLREHKAIKITVKGKGISSQDAICVRLGASSSNSYADYFVRLNYDGWRELIIPSLDNGEFTNYTFEGKEDNINKMHINGVDLSRVGYVYIYQSTGCEGVDIKKVEAVPIVSNALMNPTVHIGSTSIVFKDTIQSGEYIEYTVGDKKALVYDNIGNSRAINVSRRGRFRVPHGSFVASVSGTPELNDAPSEAVLTLGLYGSYIHN